MDYPSWIERERRIRLKILGGSPEIRSSHVYRVCRSCGEVCLCHEEHCPNCGAGPIESIILESSHDVSGRIRCTRRFFDLEGALDKP